MTSPSPRPALALTQDEWAVVLAELGQPAFRVRQISDWIWKKQATSWKDMKNLPPVLRNTLAASFPLRTLKPALAQGEKGRTRKFLYQLDDGQYVESVLLPAGQSFFEDDSGRLTLCVSSQVGCAFGCRFCASGLGGFVRNLRTDEIVEQIVQAIDLAGQKINNIVFMGMGEPLANWDNFIPALDFINESWGLNIGARHLTVSTSGHAPHIRRLADDPRQIRLAVSLHGASNEVRGKIMPVNHKWPLEELFKSLDYWTLKKKQMITFEYILIEGVNNSPEQLKLLISHAKRFHAKINLIPYNTVEGLPWNRPSEDSCRLFRDALARAGVPVTLRIEKGNDIDAACGQLRLKKERKEQI